MGTNDKIRDELVEIVDTVEQHVQSHSDVDVCVNLAEVLHFILRMLEIIIIY